MNGEGDPQGVLPPSSISFAPKPKRPKGFVSHPFQPPSHPLRRRCWNALDEINKIYKRERKRSVFAGCVYKNRLPKAALSETCRGRSLAPIEFMFNEKLDVDRILGAHKDRNLMCAQCACAPGGPGDDTSHNLRLALDNLAGSGVGH